MIADKYPDIVNKYGSIMDLFNFQGYPMEVLVGSRFFDTSMILESLGLSLNIPKSKEDVIIAMKKMFLINLETCNILISKLLPDPEAKMKPGHVTAGDLVEILKTEIFDDIED